MQKPSTQHTIAFIFIGVAAAILWGGALNHGMLSPDELMHISLARTGTWAELWQRSLYETHPPLGHALRRLLLPEAGAAAWQYRLPSLICVLLALPLWAAIGARAGGQAGAAAMLALLVISTITTGIASEARNYALFVLLAALAVWACLKLLEKQKMRFVWLLAVALFLASATHFTGGVLAAILGLYGSVCLRTQPRQWLRFAASFVPTALLAALCYHFFFAEGTLAAGWASYYQQIGKHYTTSAATLAENVMRLSDLPQWAPLPSAVWLALSAFLLAHMRASRHRLFSLVALFWVVALCAAIAQFYPLTATRHMAYGLICVALPYAYGVGLLPRLWQQAAMALSCLACAGCVWLAFSPRAASELSFDERDYKALVKRFRQLPAQEAPVIVNRFTALYLDYSLDGGAVFYNNPTQDALRTRQVGQADYITDATLYRWSYDASRLRHVLAFMEAHYGTATHWHFMSIGRYAWDIEPFYTCLKQAGDVAQEAREAGALWFAVPREAPALSRCIEQVQERPE